MRGRGFQFFASSPRLGEPVRYFESRSMKPNPYQSPKQHEVVDVAELHPVARDTCPVCLSRVRRWRLFWYSSDKCTSCGTVLSLAQSGDDKAGLGCVAVAGVGVIFVGYSVIATIWNGTDSLYGILVLIPLAAIYGACVRWFKGVPYPRSLIVAGRIPGSEQPLASESQDSG